MCACSLDEVLAKTRCFLMVMMLMMMSLEGPLLPSFAQSKVK